MQPLDPPVPIRASYNGGNPTLVTFDQPLTAAALNRGNWTVYHNNLRWSILDARVPTGPFKRTVQLFLGFSQAHPIVDQVVYQPPPFDVTTLKQQIPAAAFTGFPLGP